MGFLISRSNLPYGIFRKITKFLLIPKAAFSSKQYNEISNKDNRSPHPEDISELILYFQPIRRQGNSCLTRVSASNAIMQESKKSTNH